MKLLTRLNSALPSALVLAVLAISAPAASAADKQLHKVRDAVLYDEPRFYNAFPSVVRRPDGKLFVAFRRAPDRRALGEKGNQHVDPNSYLVAVRSRDGGQSWSPGPEPLFAHPLGGSQDPCLLQLSDGELICLSYLWTFVRPDGIPNLKPPVFQNYPGSFFSGGFFIRSSDGGASWKGPFSPPTIAPEKYLSPHGDPLPAYNRGAAIQGREGRLFWAVAANDQLSPRRTSVHLLTSEDRGQTWTYSAPIAADAKASFNETSMYETPKGDLIAFLRSEDLEDQACIARSTDGGRTFQPWRPMGFQGHPLHALRLPDNCVLLTYGYRHKPYGIRARVLNAECTDFATAPEMILRDDGGSTDLGYPWSAMIDDTRVIVVYYFNRDGGRRHIAATFLELR
ncbi:MAG: exo-alpha-sialidase [Verrucomicrobia bacterium]|nr:exo-alpha-sialidase [Verrucomicrobiota bacterium]